jgi:hypothetical protein
LDIKPDYDQSDITPSGRYSFTAPPFGFQCSRSSFDVVSVLTSTRFQDLSLVTLDEIHEPNKGFQYYV